MCYCFCRVPLFKKTVKTVDFHDDGNRGILHHFRMCSKIVDSRDRWDSTNQFSLQIDCQPCQQHIQISSKRTCCNFDKRIRWREPSSSLFWIIPLLGLVEVTMLVANSKLEMPISSYKIHRIKENKTGYCTLCTLYTDSSQCTMQGEL